MKRALTLIVLGFAAPLAQAGTLSVSGSSGGLSAEARFENTGRGLAITLIDRSAATNHLTQVLSAVFFDVASGETLSAAGASRAGVNVPFVNAGSGAPAGAWAYSGALVGAPGNAGRGIACTDFGAVMAPATVPFSTTNVAAHAARVSGTTIVTDAPAAGNDPALRGGITFILSGIGDKFDPSQRIRNVTFVYAPSLSKSNESMTLVPLPGAGAMGLVGFGALASRRRRAGV